MLSRSAIESSSRRIIDEFSIRCAGIKEPVDALSGGNQQKLVIGRELSRNPKVIIAAQPTRGVDIGAIEYIHHRLLDMRERNTAIVLISAELDELLALSDRILVLYEGQIVAEGPSFSEAALGLLMAGSRE
jgi:simple sugar transport system ATP-binding protein